MNSIPTNFVNDAAFEISSPDSFFMLESKYLPPEKIGYNSGQEASMCFYPWFKKLHEDDKLKVLRSPKAYERFSHEISFAWSEIDISKHENTDPELLIAAIKNVKSYLGVFTVMEKLLMISSGVAITEQVFLSLLDQPEFKQNDIMSFLKKCFAFSVTDKVLLAMLNKCERYDLIEAACTKAFPTAITEDVFIELFKKYNHVEIRVMLKDKFTCLIKKNLFLNMIKTWRQEGYPVSLIVKQIPSALLTDKFLYDLTFICSQDCILELMHKTDSSIFDFTCFMSLCMQSKKESIDYGPLIACAINDKKMSIAWNDCVQDEKTLFEIAAAHKKYDLVRELLIAGRKDHLVPAIAYLSRYEEFALHVLSSSIIKQIPSSLLTYKSLYVLACICTQDCTLELMLKTDPLAFDFTGFMSLCMYSKKGFFDASPLIACAINDRKMCIDWKKQIWNEKNLFEIAVIYKKYDLVKELLAAERTYNLIPIIAYLSQYEEFVAFIMCDGEHFRKAIYPRLSSLTCYQKLQLKEHGGTFIEQLRRFKSSLSILGQIEIGWIIDTLQELKDKVH